MSAINQVPSNAGPSQQAPAEASSGSPWVYRARIASQIALPIIMNVSFVLAMVCSMAFPPATVFLLIGVGVVTGLFWHTIPDPYAALGGNSPQTDAPPEKPAPRTKKELKAQQRAEWNQMDEGHAAKKAELNGNAGNDVLKKKQQLWERAVDRRKMERDHALQNADMDHKRKLETASPRKAARLKAEHEASLKGIHDQFDPAIKLAQERLDSINQDLNSGQIDLDYEQEKAGLLQKKQERQNQLDELIGEKKPSDDKRNTAESLLGDVFSLEDVELDRKFDLLRAEANGCSPEEIEAAQNARKEAAEKLASKNEELKAAILEIDPSVLTRMGTTLQSMGSAMSQAAGSARGAISGVPARVRGSLPSPAPISNHLKQAKNGISSAAVQAGDAIKSGANRLKEILSKSSFPSFGGLSVNDDNLMISDEDSFDRLMKPSSSSTQNVEMRNFYDEDNEIDFANAVIRPFDNEREGENVVKTSRQDEELLIYIPVEEGNDREKVELNDWNALPEGEKKDDTYADFDPISLKDGEDIEDAEDAPLLGSEVSPSKEQTRRSIQQNPIQAFKTYFFGPNDPEPVRYHDEL